MTVVLKFQIIQYNIKYIYIALMPPSIVKLYYSKLHHNMRASSRSCFTSKAKFNVSSDLSTSPPFNRFWKWFEGVVFRL